MAKIKEVCVKYREYPLLFERWKSMTKKSAIVVGATGLVGTSLVKQLCENENYVSVLAIGRNKVDYQHEKLTQHLSSFEELVDADFDFAHEVFCCLGTTRKKAGSREQVEKVDYEYPLRVATIAKNRRIEHFLVISAMGANDKSLAHYSRVKGKLEEALIKFEFPRLSIIRPSLLVGKRAEFRLGEAFGAAVLKVANPLLVGGLKKYRSIAASQVALAMMCIALSNEKTSVKIYNSDELLQMVLPESEQREDEMIDRDPVFNWSKIKDDVTVVDDEVVFKRDKDKKDN